MSDAASEWMERRETLDVCAKVWARLEIIEMALETFKRDVQELEDSKRHRWNPCKQDPLHDRDMDQWP